MSTIPRREPGARAALAIAEVFGPTFQGEGPSAGRLAMFVRLGRCNLDCEWCDEKQTWDWATFDPATELTNRTTDDLLTELDRIGAPLLVITGGEPMLQQRDLIPLIAGAKQRGWKVEIETNGTIAPLAELAELVDQWNVSPKLAGSGVARSRRWRPEAVRALAATGRAVGKFVVSDLAELDEVATVAESGHIRDVWVMPEATDAATLAERLTLFGPAVLARGWNLSSRLHIVIWGDRRGV